MQKYPPRHGLQLFRLADSSVFQCARCTQAKKSKLYALSAKYPGRKLCNGCYGRLLSILDVENKALPEAEKADLLADLLLQSFSTAQKQEAERLFRLSEKRTEHLDQKSVTFIATSLALRDALDTKCHLDWSPAIIGFCKAVENEVVLRLLNPLADDIGGDVPEEELRDKDVGRIARFCQKPTTKPPELGTLSYFLQTFANSKRRRETYHILRTLSGFVANLPQGSWLVGAHGLASELRRLTEQFRNRAAHLDQLGEQDYGACQEFVVGKQGLIWKIVSATLGQKEFNKA